jgi:hypothetical protein
MSIEVGTIVEAGIGDDWDRGKVLEIADGLDGGDGMLHCCFLLPLIQPEGARAARSFEVRT